VATLAIFDAKIYNIKEGDVFWAASDVGWVVGHSFIVYGPLINRNSSIFLKGNLSDASTFGELLTTGKRKCLQQLFAPLKRRSKWRFHKI
jgi:acyl-coenzyme A synthetase/AMP-(fatty) acid ligase